MTIIRRAAAALASSALLLTAACGLGQSGDSGGGDGDNAPIKIGTLLSVTGPAANLGDKMRKGAELAIEEINASGGIAGRPIAWTFYDPAGDTSTAVSQTRRLLDNDGVELVVGGGSQSGIALAMDPLTSAAGKLFIATEGARQIVQPAESHPLTFKTTFNDTAMVQRTIDFWTARGITRVAFLPDTTSFGQSAAEEMQRLAPAAGITVEVAPFDPGTNDLTPQISRLAANNPQAYLAWTTAPSGVTFLRNVRAVVPDPAVLVQHGFGFVDDRFFTQAGEAGVGTILTSPKLPVYDLLPDSDPQKQPMTAFADAYRARYGGEQPNVYAGQAYDAVKVAAAAIEKAGGTDGAQLAEAIETLGEHVGVTGVFRYTAQDHSGLAPDNAVMIQWDGTRFVPVT
jgi:branched-chain amino acid transport system substrate-binding protein